jgi:hypothetical protein
MSNFPEGPFTDEQLDELGKTKEGIRHYFTLVAKKNFLLGNNAADVKTRKIHIRLAMVLYQNMDEIVESTYNQEYK